MFLSYYLNLENSAGDLDILQAYTLHPTAFTIQPTAFTQQPSPYSLHPTPYTVRPET